jgi:pimeloyl-ACP methyl ester carboxylesterase
VELLGERAQALRQQLVAAHPQRELATATAEDLALDADHVAEIRAYADLVAAFGDSATPLVKDLEVYADERPPPDFSLETEVEGIARAAHVSGFDRFHLVGYSAGGASSLAFAARHPERLLSLALLEPAWAGNARTPTEDALAERFRALRRLPGDEFMRAFVELQLAPGVEPPPPPDGPAPPWMAKRPGGLGALMEAFDAGDLDLAALVASAGDGAGRIPAPRAGDDRMAPVSR